MVRTDGIKLFGDVKMNPKDLDKIGYFECPFFKITASIGTFLGFLKNRFI